MACHQPYNLKLLPCGRDVCNQDPNAAILDPNSYSIAETDAGFETTKENVTSGQVTRHRDSTPLEWAVQGVHFQVPQLPGQEENDCVPGTGLHQPRRQGQCSHTGPQIQPGVLEIATGDAHSWGLLRE